MVERIQDSDDVYQIVWRAKTREMDGKTVECA